MPTQRFSKWPDFLELTIDDEGNVTSPVFVCVRKNSRSFQQDQLQTLRALEYCAKVVVRVGTSDLTIDEFEQQGTFRADIAPKMIAQSTYYNKRAELKRYEQELRKLELDDPSRESVWMRVQKLRTQLGLEAEGAELDEVYETQKSSFNSLVEKLNKGTTVDEYSDEQLLRIDWPTIAKMKEPQHTTLWKRKVELHRAKEITHDAEQPGTTHQDRVDGKADGDVPPVVDVNASSESD